MSFVGKFFVVMQILLSVTFMGFAVTVFTYQKDWKTKANDQEVKNGKLQAQLNNLQQEYDKFRQDTTNTLKTERDRADRAESAHSAVQRRFEEEQNAKQQLANDLTSQSALAQIAEDEAESRRTEAMTQRVANTELHKKLKEKTDHTLVVEDELYNLKVVQKSLEKKNKMLAQQIAFQNKVLRTHKLETNPQVYAALQEPPPKLDGLVTDASTDKKGAVDHVEVSLGSDDGLVKGHTLSVFRSGLQTGEKAKYLGQIELVDVASDRSVGRVIQKAKSGIIKRGDNVTSKL